MTRVSKGVVDFQKLTKSMLKEAAKDGKNINKAQVTEALGKLTADGKVSKADKAAAMTMLEDAPLTAGAKESLENFVAGGDTNAPNTRPNNPLNARLRFGGSESGGGRRSGGGEAAPSRPSPSRGGGEVSRPSYGGGGYGGGYSRGGGE